MSSQRENLSHQRPTARSSQIRADLAATAAATDELASVRQIYGSGRYATAYRRGLALGLWQRLGEPNIGILGARVIRQAGGERHARLVVLATWRRHRELPEARYWYVSELHNPVRAWQAMDRFGDPPDSDPDLLRDWYLLRVAKLAVVRDFAAAERWWRRATELPPSPWTWCVRALLDSVRDDTAAALEALDRALAMHPRYAPAASLKVAMLRRSRRTEDALALAVELDAELEVNGIAAQEHFLRCDLGDYAGALSCLERVVQLSPAMDRAHHDWLALRMARTAKLAGDDERVRRLAANIRLPGLAELADRPATATGGRTVLAVPAVPQHHNTCGPASLTSIARYWQVAVEHEEVVEEICRDGTTAYSERRWAETQGWLVREFTMTWEATRQLIDAGAPFVFVTTFETNGHLQAAIGYDAQLGAIVVRDPSQLSMVELSWSELERTEAAFGPRAMVLVPTTEAGRLRGLELPDVELYDLLYELEAALDCHDRERASAAVSVLGDRAPHHIITLRARRALATYDADPLGPLVWADAMLAQFPGDHRVQLSKLRAMDGHASIDERLQFSARCLARTRTPMLLMERATLLATTPGGRDRAELLMWHALDCAPASSGVYRALANHQWGSNQRSSATLLYRLGSCLAEGDESAAWSYFLAERLTGEVEVGLDHLRSRVERFGDRSPAAARTLADAYEVENRHAEGIAVLEAAEAAHSEDGWFLCGMADYHMKLGRLDRARELLERARSTSKPTLWRRSAAALATIEADRERAIEHWRAVAASEPLAMDALHALADAACTTEGPDVAVADLDELWEKFPYHVPLAHLRYDLLSRFDDNAAREHVEAFSRRHPADCWAHREVALALAREGDVQGALVRLEQARMYGDDSPQHHATLGSIRESAGDAEAAREAYRRALERSVDTAYAITALFKLAASRDARIDTLAFVYRQLERQRSEGPAIHAYLAHARDWLEREEVARKLDDLVALRPDSFDAHLARLLLDSDAGTAADALARAQAVAARFPMVPGAWLVLAQVCERAADVEGQREALRCALAINPRWGVAIRELAIAHVTAGELERARTELKRAVADQPLDPVHRGYLADVLWQLGDRDGALAEIEQALRLSPSYRWGWERLAQWSAAPADAVNFARQLSSTRGTHHAIWIALAELMSFAPLATRLECLEEAIRLRPSEPEAYDLKARLLAEAGHYDAALEACAPALWSGSPPIELRGRAAWVRYLRGDRQGAVGDMMAIVSELPDYPWGVRCLIAWAREDDRWSYVDACRRIAEVAERSAAAQAEYGEALRHSGDHEPAEAAFRRALELAPRDRYASLCLADLFLERKRADDAADSLSSLDPTDLAVVVRRVRIAIARNNPEQTCEAMTRVLRLPESGSALDEVFAEPMPRAVAAAVGALMTEWVMRAEAGRDVGSAWLRHVGGQLSTRRLWRRLAEMPRGSAAQIAALQTYVESLTKRGDRLMLWLLLRFRRNLLRASTRTWGSVSFALLRMGRWRRTVRWMSDFRQRRDAESWMLWNLSIAARVRRRHELAAEVNERALSLAEDVTTHRHRLRLACWRALRGDPSRAVRLLADSEGPPWSHTDRFVADVARALLTWRERDGDTRERFGQLAAELRAAYAQFERQGGGREGHAIYRAVIREAARTLGGLGGLIWRLRMAS